MKRITDHVGFHDLAVAERWDDRRPGRSNTRFTYVFQNFFHPFVGELITRLNTGRLADIFDPVWQGSLKSPDPTSDPAHDFFRSFYQPRENRFVRVESFRKELDFSESGPYAVYNWELFFHVPLTVAVHLSKTRRFAEAQRWFHYIFNPTSNDTSVLPPRRFWNFLAFRREKDPKQIDELLALLSTPPSELSGEDRQLRTNILNGYRAILDKPFQPHAVARTRHLAYQYGVVMKYLDNLIAWGDDLFQQDTIESINEATQIYVLAANLLGPRPQRIPARAMVRPRTFAQLKAAGLDAMGNALVELEGMFPFNTAPSSAESESGSPGSGPLFGIGRSLYFCIPRNERMLGYWDTVGDRLFKIRNCMNIQGVVRPLALFDPPLDPGMLVKAAGAGLDPGGVAGALNQPIGPVRSLILIQKALELCGEVRGLGNALLAAFERGDAEHFALIRQRHEIQIQQTAQEVRFLQWKQIEEATTSLLTNRGSALERLRYYKRLLGLKADENAPETLTLDRRRLTEENFDEAYAALVDQYDKPLMRLNLPEITLVEAASPDIISGLSGRGKVHLTKNEDRELNSHLPAARDYRLAASELNFIASTVAGLPDPTMHGHYWGIGVSSTITGGQKLAVAAKMLAEIAQIKSASEQDQAGMAARYASYERREDEWILQHNLAASELAQIGRQILTSLIAEQIAHHEYQTLKQQIANAVEVDRFLHDKFTNEDLHLWMQGEISRLYYEYYRLAVDTARKAERTMKQELMRPEFNETTFIKFNYQDGGRKGLLSGEALYLDLKKMEAAYLENNKREYELVKHVSLRQLDPLALLGLKAAGSCEVTVPEWLFDLDNPGHYMRRIKSVSLSIPSVSGPYTSVSCTLSLLKSTVRKSPATEGEYARQGADDDRFVDYRGPVQSIVTSSGQNDGGMFETNLKDERFLPFEGAGAASTWKLELPENFRQFDYGTITDVLLHIRYTARPGGEQLRNQATASIESLVGEAGESHLALLFSLRHDFPTEWAAFVNGTADFTATIRKDDFPYLTEERKISVVSLDLYAQNPVNHHPVGDQTVWEAATADLENENKQAFSVTIPPDGPGPNPVLLRTADAQVFLIVRYTLGD